MNEQKKGTQL